MADTAFALTVDRLHEIGALEMTCDTLRGGWQFGPRVIGYVVERDAAVARVRLTYWLGSTHRDDLVEIVPANRWKQTKLICPHCRERAQTLRLPESGPGFLCNRCVRAQAGKRRASAALFRAHEYEKQLEYEAKASRAMRHGGYPAMRWDFGRKRSG